MDAHKESCPTKTTLLRSWQDATETYSKAVTKLSRGIGKSSKSEYERLSKAADLARVASNKIKEALDTHTDEHECDGRRDGAAVVKPSNP